MTPVTFFLGFDLKSSPLLCYLFCFAPSTLNTGLNYFTRASMGRSQLLLCLLPNYELETIGYIRPGLWYIVSS